MGARKGSRGRSGSGSRDRSRSKDRKDRLIGTTDREVAPHRGRRGQEVGQINGGREKKIQLRIVLILFVCCINFRESSSILKGRLYCQSIIIVFFPILEAKLRINLFISTQFIQRRNDDV